MHKGLNRAGSCPHRVVRVRRQVKASSFRHHPAGSRLKIKIKRKKIKRHLPASSGVSTQLCYAWVSTVPLVVSSFFCKQSVSQETQIYASEGAGIQASNHGNFSAAFSKQEMICCTRKGGPERQRIALQAASSQADRSGRFPVASSRQTAASCNAPPFE